MYYYVYDGRVVYGGLSANDRFEIFLKVCSMFWIGSLGKCIGFLLIFSMNFTLVRGCYMHTSWAKELNQSILKCIKLVKICWEKNSGTTIYWLRHQFGKPYICINITISPYDLDICHSNSNWNKFIPFDSTPGFRIGNHQCFLPKSCRFNEGHREIADWSQTHWCWDRFRDER